MMSFKKIISFFLIVVLLFGIASFSAFATDSDIVDYTDVVEGFDINTSTGDFTIGVDGFSWKSSPIFDGFDELAPGIEKSNQRSLILIEYLDVDGNVATANSYIDSVSNDGMKVNAKNNSATVTYYFSDIGIGIPMKLKYSKGVLTVSVETSGIQERSENKLLTITLLPYFGAAKKGEQGYVFIPDGSGAIISLEENNAYNKFYEKEIYGENSVLYKDLDDTVEKQIYLPVFGIKQGENAMLGIVTEGDGVASIVSNVASGYYTVAPKFVYRQVDESHLQAGSTSEKIVKITPKVPTNSKFSVSYSFLKNEEANYVGMANAYQKYLVDKYSLKNNAKGTSLDLNFLATTEIQKSFLGIPYTGLETLTDLDDVQNVIDALDEAQCNNVRISLKGALFDGLYGKMPNKIKLSNKVGSLKNYKKIEDSFEENGGKLYLLTDILHVYKTGNGISSASGTARDVGGAISKQYNYYPENFAKNEERSWKLVNAESLYKITNSLAKSVKKNDVNIGLAGSADELYGDYHIKYTLDRAGMLDEMLNAYKRLSKANGKMYFDNANIYALEYADMISSIPLSSSQYDMFTYDIPFYQLVLHGIVDYSSPALNLSGNVQENYLRSIEYGAALRYDLVCQNSDLLNKSSAVDLYSGNCDDWLDSAINNSNEISKFYISNDNCNIVAHEQVLEGVFRTEYSNGNVSIVNYNDYDVEFDSHMIKANNFKLIMKGE